MLMEAVTTLFFSLNCTNFVVIRTRHILHALDWTHTLFRRFSLLFSTTITDLRFGFAFSTLLSRDPFWYSPEVANGFSCPAPGEVSSAGSFSRHAHPEDCRKYYICLEGVAREYGCPIGTVFKIGDSDGTGNCEDPEDVPGWWVP